MRYVSRTAAMGPPGHHRHGQTPARPRPLPSTNRWAAAAVDRRSIAEGGLKFVADCPKKKKKNSDRVKRRTVCARRANLHTPSSMLVVEVPRASDAIQTLLKTAEIAGMSSAHAIGLRNGKPLQEGSVQRPGFDREADDVSSRNTVYDQLPIRAEIEVNLLGRSLNFSRVPDGPSASISASRPFHPSCGSASSAPCGGSPAAPSIGAGARRSSARAERPISAPPRAPDSTAAARHPFARAPGAVRRARRLASSSAVRSRP